MPLAAPCKLAPELTHFRAAAAALVVSTLLNDCKAPDEHDGGQYQSQKCPSHRRRCAGRWTVGDDQSHHETGSDEHNCDTH